MTVEQLIQLYTPMAGLVALAFWSGVLSNRVRTLEREEGHRKERERVALEERDRLVRMETTMDELKKQLERTNRELAGVHRALAHISTGKGGHAGPLLDGTD